MNILIKSISGIVIPCIFILCIYIQINGEFSPGGGFQSGVVLASLFISISLSGKYSKILEIFNEKSLIISACIGVFTYSGIGFTPIFYNMNYMNYDVASILFDISKTSSQSLCIVVVELCVGLTVFSTMYLMYIIFSETIEKVKSKNEQN